MVVSRIRVFGAAPKRSTWVSSSRAHFSASSLLSKDLHRGFMPRRRTWACQRPLSLRIVAIVISNGLLLSITRRMPLEGSQGLSRHEDVDCSRQEVLTIIVSKRRL